MYLDGKAVQQPEPSFLTENGPIKQTGQGQLEYQYQTSASDLSSRRTRGQDAAQTKETFKSAQGMPPPVTGLSAGAWILYMIAGKWSGVSGIHGNR